MPTLGSATFELSTNAAPFNKGMAAAEATASKTTKSISARLAGLSTGFAAVGRKFTSHITLPILALGGVSTKMAFDFNKSMTDIAALVGASAEQVKEYEHAVLGLAKAGKGGPQELAKALYFVTSSGFEGAAALRVLDASAMAAEAGLGNVQSVANLVTSAVNVYGEKNLSAAAAVDVLTAAVREGKAEPEEFAASLGRVIPISQQMGVSFGEVAGATAALTLGGLDGAEATTALRAAMLAAFSPTKQAKDALADVGISSDDLRKSIRERGLLASIVTLNEKFNGSTEAISAVFSNVRGLVGALNLAGERAGANALLIDRVKNSVGDTARAFETAGLSPAKQFKDAMNAIKASMIQVGSVLTPFVAQLANSLARVALAFTDLSPRAQKFVLIALGIAAAIGPVLKLTSMLITSVRDLGRSYTFLATHPVVLAIVAIVAIGAAMVVLYKTNKRFHDAVEPAWKKTKKTISGVVGTLRELWAKYGENIMAIARGAWEQVKALIRAALLVIRGIVNVVMGLLSGDWRRAWKGIQQVFTGIWDAIVARLRYAWTFISEIAKMIYKAFADQFQAIKRAAFQVALDIIEPFTHLPKWLGGWARKAKNSLLAELGGAVAPAGIIGASVGASFGANMLSQASAYAARVKDIMSYMAGPSLPAKSKAPPKVVVPLIPDFTGGGDVGGGDADTFELPLAMRVAQGRAEITTRLDDDLKAFKAEAAWLKGQMGKLTGETLLSAMSMYKGVLDSLKTIADEKKAAADEVADALKEAASIQARDLAAAVGRERESAKQLDKIIQDEQKVRAAAAKKIVDSAKKASDSMFKALAAAGIAAARAQVTAAQSALSNINEAITANKSAFSSAWSAMTSTGLDKFNQATQAAVEKMRRDMNDALSAFDKETQEGIDGITSKYEALTPAAQALQELTTAHELAADAARLAADQQAVETARAEGDTVSLATAEAALKETLYQAKVKALTATAALETSAAQERRDAEIEQFKNERATSRTAQEQRLQDDISAYEQQRGAQKTAFEAQQKDLENQMLLRNTTYDSANGAILTMFAKFGVALGATDITLPDGSSIKDPFSTAIEKAQENLTVLRKAQAEAEALSGSLAAAKAAEAALRANKEAAAAAGAAGAQFGMPAIYGGRGRIPQAAVGARIISTGVALVHRDEVVIPAKTAPLTDAQRNLPNGGSLVNVEGDLVVRDELGADMVASMLSRKITVARVVAG